MAALVLGQLLLAFTATGEGPVRFGFPLPAAQLARGLRLEAAPGARLQWRPLHELPDRETGRLWVELAIAGATGRIAIHVGGAGPVDGRTGTVVRVTTDESSAGDRQTRRTRWDWCTGERDERATTVFLATTEHEGEVFAAGEALTTSSPDLEGRCVRVAIAAREWRRAGVLPGSGSAARSLRVQLAEAATWLQELPGARGRGDYARSGGIVTNLEFDTALALLRLGLAEESAALVARALTSARHLVDHDLDPKSGLPFRHGKDHRGAPPEPGHAWLTGLLLAGCVAADDALIAAARSIAHSLARHPPAGQGEHERARDYGWPLLELEAWLRFADDPVPRRAADRFAHELMSRWDARNRVLRFGEGERDSGCYEERGWITGGIPSTPCGKPVVRTGSRAGLKSTRYLLSATRLAQSPKMRRSLFAGSVEEVSRCSRSNSAIRAANGARTLWLGRPG